MQVKEAEESLFYISNKKTKIRIQEWVERRYTYTKELKLQKNDGNLTNVKKKNDGETSWQAIIFR